MLKRHFTTDIAATDLAAILSRLNPAPYITQEVIFGAGQPIMPNEYTGNGASSLLVGCGAD